MENKLSLRVDFHTHANPLELDSGKHVVDIAKLNNIKAIAIFAREQVLPYYDELIEYGNKNQIDVFTGVETLSIIDGKPVELICIGFDAEKIAGEGLFSSHKSNVQIAQLQKEFLESKGFNFDQIQNTTDLELFNSVMSGMVGEKAIRLCQILTRNDVMHSRISELISQNSELWERVVNTYSQVDSYKDDPLRLNAKFLYLLYFDVKKEGFEYVSNKFDEYIPTVGTLISMIHDAHGLVLYSPEGDFNSETWEKLLEENIDGIMGWHGSSLGFELEKRDIPSEVIKYCIKSQLLVLGGSDFNNGDWRLGSGSNDKLFMSKRRLDDLTKKLSQNNSL